MNLHHLRHGWFVAIFFFCAALVVSNLIHWIIFRFFRREQATGSTSNWGIKEHLSNPSRAIFLLTCVLLVLPLIPNLPGSLEATIRHWTAMAIVAALGWFFIGLVYVVEANILRKYDIKASDNRRARSVHTQLQVLRRIVIGFVVILTAGALLWTSNNPRIWQYGSGLLASAGIASLLLASAAKSTASNMLAGIQIAFTEPFRIDDVVVVQGSWGRIEEIRSSYVVVRIWDQRRLIVPLSYFIDNAFENWTRNSADILAYPYIYVDYSVPVPELRAEFERIVRAHPLWDGKALNLQVTNLTPPAMELRCLASVRNSADQFALACDIREGMIAYVRQHHPEGFPVTRSRPIHPPEPITAQSPEPQPSEGQSAARRTIATEI